MSDGAKPISRATVFMDYVHPFCEVGYVRLDRLRDGFDLRLNCCSEGRNLAGAAVLMHLVEQVGLPAGFPAQARTEPRYERRLMRNRAAARELDATGTPTVFIGQQRLTGVASADEFREAARLAGTDQ